MQKAISIIPIYTIGEISPTNNLGKTIFQAVTKQKISFEEQDIIVVTQKIVSKAEGRVVDLSTTNPSPFAQEIAKQHKKDARYMEVVLQETKRIVRMDHGVLICETHHGFICANAGVDASNIKQTNSVSLLPLHPDQSAKKIRDEVKKIAGMDLGIIISDTWGRPWREGQVNMAIGSAGIEPLTDYRGQEDQYGYELQASVIAIADELAGAAELVMGKTDSVPVAIIRGYTYAVGKNNAQALLRNPIKDMFR